MLILASQSPRRRELLGRITEQFIVRPTGCDESFICADPAEHARQLALRKCAAAVTESAPDDAVIAADTVVFLEGVLLEKPASVAAAKAMLRRLSGHTHVVCTGVAVAYKGETRSFVQQTRVTFHDLSDSLMRCQSQRSCRQDVPYSRMEDAPCRHRTQATSDGIL